jgi:glucan biosynthesis protein C
MTLKTQALTRRYELDWLRILAILGVFIYHSLRFFDTQDWHLKNAIVHPGLDPLMKFFELWGMPLLFTISGAAVYYSLAGRPAGRFLRARAARLLVPLGAGVFTHAMWQVYLERSSHGLVSGSFIEFIPRYFNGLYGLGGNFAWMGLHLWYLEVLFVFSLALLPAFVWLRKGKGKGFLLSLTDVLRFPGGVYFFAAPIMLISLLNPDTILTARAFGGLSISICLLFFLNGFFVVSNDRLYESIRTMRWVSLGSGMAATALIGAAYFRFGEPVFGTAYYTALISAFGLCSWLWVLALLGFAAGRLRFPSRFLIYASEAVLPFYILHQPMLLAFGSLFIPASIPEVMRWAFLSAAAFVSSAGMYEFLIRRRGSVRFLFGLPAASTPSSTASFFPRALFQHRSVYPDLCVFAGKCGARKARVPEEYQPFRIESRKNSL